MENSQQKFKYSVEERFEKSPLTQNFDHLSPFESHSPSTDAASTDFSDDWEDFDDPSYMLYFSGSKLQYSSDVFRDSDLESLPSPFNEKGTKCKRVRKSMSKRWTADEDKLLVDLYFQYALDWKKIAKLIPGRAADAVKNRFYGVIKKNASFSDQNKFCIAARKARESKAAGYQIVFGDALEPSTDTNSVLPCKNANSTLLEQSISELQKEVENVTNLSNIDAKLNYLNALKQKAEQLEGMLMDVKGKLKPQS